MRQSAVLMSDDQITAVHDHLIAGHQLLLQVTSALPCNTDQTRNITSVWHHHDPERHERVA